MHAGTQQGETNSLTQQKFHNQIIAILTRGTTHLGKIFLDDTKLHIAFDFSSCTPWHQLPSGASQGPFCPLAACGILVRTAELTAVQLIRC